MAGGDDLLQLLGQPPEVWWVRLTIGASEFTPGGGWGRIVIPVAVRRDHGDGQRSVLAILVVCAEVVGMALVVVVLGRLPHPEGQVPQGGRRVQFSIQILVWMVLVSLRLFVVTCSRNDVMVWHRRGRGNRVEDPKMTEPYLQLLVGGWLLAVC